MSQSPPQVPGPVPLVGIIADPHIGQTSSEAMVRACIDWLVARGVSAVLVAGDLNERPGQTGFLAWARDPAGGGLPANVQILPCVGNWDTEVPPGVYDSTPENPHATMMERHSWLYQGGEYYRWSLGGLSVFSLNNLSDYVQGSGQTAYANCNPPGTRTVCNPDHSGITDPQSAQRQWLDAEFAAVEGMPWKVILWHRPAYANFDQDPRRINVDARAALAVPLSLGLSIVLGGDQHVGCLCGPINAAGELAGLGEPGAYHLTLPGGFQCRPIDNSLVPTGSLLWSRGGSPVEPVCCAATLALGEEQAGLAIFEVSAADPTGSVVYAGNLARNPGGQ